MGRPQGIPVLIYILFAGLPLKRAVSTGIDHPGTNGEICFSSFRA
jgi:hypothetical protein